MENKKYLHILVDHCVYLTQWKLYEVVKEEEEGGGCYIIMDDEGDLIWLQKVGYDPHTQSREGFKVYEQYTKVRTFDSINPNGFPQNGKVYEAEIVDCDRRTVCYRAGRCEYTIIVNYSYCAFLNEGGKWEILGNDFKEEESEPVNTISVDSTEYKIQVMQAFLDGEEIEFNPCRSLGWTLWGLGQPNWNWGEHSYRIKPKEELKLSIDWSQVADEYRYLALDACGNCYLYERLPIIGGGRWGTERGGSVCTAFAFSSLVIPEGINWKESLVERPK